VYCIKTAENFFSWSDRPTILVFQQQRSLRKSDGFTPNGGADYNAGSNFATNMWLYLGNGNRSIEAQLLCMYVLNRMVPLLMTLSDPTPSFKVTV